MTTFQTILMLLLMAGLIVCYEAIKKTIPLNKKRAFRVLQELGSQKVEEVHEYIMFSYQDTTF